MQHDDDLDEDWDDDDAEYADDDDEQEEEDDGSPGADSEAEIAAVEKAFRTDRATIRGASDLAQLRQLRANYEAMAGDRRFGAARRLRCGDLVELVDDRITDLKAKRLADRGR